MQILTFTVVLEDDTETTTAVKLMEKTMVILTRFMKWMGQEDATIGSNLETT